MFAKTTIHKLTHSKRLLSQQFCHFVMFVACLSFHYSCSTLICNFLLLTCTIFFVFVVLTNPTILIGGTGDGSRTTIAAMAAHSPTQRLSLNLSTRNRRHTGNSGVVNGYNINLVVTLVVVYFSM